MSTMTTYPPASLRRSGSATLLIRRVALGIELLLLVLLLAGRTVGAIGDTHLSPDGAPLAPTPMLSSPS